MRAGNAAEYRTMMNGWGHPGWERPLTPSTAAALQRHVDFREESLSDLARVAEVTLAATGRSIIPYAECDQCGGNVIFCDCGAEPTLGPIAPFTRADLSGAPREELPTVSEPLPRHFQVSWEAYQAAIERLRQAADEFMTRVLNGEDDR